MSFLNWVLLGGMAGVLAPLIIHLLNRSQFQVVDWGAMHLLDQCVEVNTRRWDWRELLLLLLRCMIPVLLALILARPVLTSWKSGGNRVTGVLLIDNSLSMSAPVDSGPESRLDRALSHAEAYLRGLPSASQFEVMTIGSRPLEVTQGLTSPKETSAKLRSIQGGRGSTEIVASLQQAIARLQDASNVNREIILVSDFQATEWSAVSPKDCQVLVGALSASEFPIHLNLLPIGTASNPENAFSVRIEPVEPAFLVPGQPFGVSVILTSHSPNQVAQASVRLAIDGVELGRKPIAIDPNGVSQLVFECRVETLGSHVIEVQADGPDSFVADNRSQYVVHTIPPVNVLLIDDRSDAPELERTTGFVSLALAPFRGQESQRNLALCKTLRPNQLRAADLQQADIVVIGDGLRVAEDLAAQIYQFVHNGGGLILSSGPSLDWQWYNRTWGHSSRWDLMPFDLAPQRPEQEQPEVAARIANSSGLAKFERALGSDLETWRIRKWTSVIETQGTNDGPTPIAGEQHVPKAPSNVILRLSDGAPLLAIRNVGEGLVFQWTSGLDERWSNIPGRPSFVPLVQSWVEHWLAKGGVESNLSTGQSVDLPRIFNQTRSVAPNKNSQATVRKIRVSDPENNQTDWSINASTTNRMIVDLPGVYRMVDDENGNHQAIAATVSDAESKLKCLSNDQIATFADQLGAHTAWTVDELLEQSRTRLNGREVWRNLLVILLCVVIAELWLQRRVLGGSAP